MFSARVADERCGSSGRPKLRKVHRDRTGTHTQKSVNQYQVSERVTLENSRKSGKQKA